MRPFGKLASRKPKPGRLREMNPMPETAARMPVSRSKQSRPHRPFPAIDVAAGLVFRQGRLLITQRPADSHLGGLWEFPGGKRQPEEGFIECLTRELREELAIEVEVQHLIDSIQHDYPEMSVRLNFYRCAWLRNEPQAIGCPAFRWVNALELADFSFPPADARLLDRLRRERELWQD